MQLLQECKKFRRFILSLSVQEMCTIPHQHLICLLILAPLSSSLGLQTLVLQALGTHRISSNSMKRSVFVLLMQSSYSMSQISHHPRRLWVYGVFSVFQQKCQVWHQHLWSSTPSKWVNARDMLLETLLGNVGMPTVSFGDFLWSFTHMGTGRKNVQVSLCCSTWPWVWYSAWGTGRNVSLKLFKTLGQQACQNINLGNCILLRLSPSLSTLVT